MHEHYRAAQCARFFQRVLKVEIVVVFKPHAAEYDNVNLSLHCDTRKQLVVRFSGAGENRQLLGNHEGVEHVDHRNTGSDHAARHNTLGRVYGRTADLYHIIFERRPLIARLARTVKDASEQVIGKAYLHFPSEEAYFIAGGNAAPACKYLQRNEVSVQFIDLRQRSSETCLYLRKLAVGHIFSLDGYNRTVNGFNLTVHFLHDVPPLLL